MDSQSEPQPNPALSRAAQDELGSELQDMLVELVDLALIGKQLAWSAVGPGSGELRSELHRLVAGWRGAADLVAARMRAAGCWPDGQATTVFQITEGWGLEPVAPGAIATEEVRELMGSRLTELAIRTRGRIDAIGQLDLPSQATLLQVLIALEEQAQEFHSGAPLPDPSSGGRLSDG